jgi:hypothetical protein
MSKKSMAITGVILFALLLGLLIAFYPPEAMQDQADNQTSPSQTETLSDSKQQEMRQGKVKSMMILIEFKDTEGLGNFVNEMKKRDIHGLLMVTPEFVQDNCADIKEVIKHNVEIVASNVEEPFWDMPYEDQKERIIEMKEGIESCTDVPVRIISSRYMASDATTLKVADELGIPYITARGTTDTKATVYEIEDYDTKILSVSNIPIVTFKYGSLCDYSFFERAGMPEDMRAELDRAYIPLSDKEKERYGPYHKVTPVSHTWIGGKLEPWQDMWINFWDENKDKIEWVTLDELMNEADWTLPLWQLPINKNAPYTPEKIRPATPYKEVEKVQNPCAVQEISGKDEPLGTQTSTQPEENKIIMFHNGTGPMCLEALDFIENLDYPVEQVLDDDENFRQRLNEMTDKYGKSEGLSDSFEYFPIIFVDDKAFSGFNDQVKEKILSELKG